MHLTYVGWILSPLLAPYDAYQGNKQKRKEKGVVVVSEEKLWFLFLIIIKVCFVSCNPSTSYQQKSNPSLLPSISDSHVVLDIQQLPFVISQGDWLLSA